MKATIERATLLRCLSHVQSVVERRNTIPILSNVLIDADVGGGVKVMATDLDLQVVETMTVASVESGGAITVSAHLLFDIARKLPDGSQVSLEMSENRMVVKAGRSRFQLPTLPRDDFPVIVEGELPTSFELPARELAELIDRTRFAISTEETRYYLNGIFLHVSDESRPVLKAAATDGHRLARYTIDRPEGAAGMPDVIVPRKAVGELRKLPALAIVDRDLDPDDAAAAARVGKALQADSLVVGRVLGLGDGRCDRELVDRERRVDVEAVKRRDERPVAAVRHAALPRRVRRLASDADAGDPLDLPGATHSRRHKPHRRAVVTRQRLAIELVGEHDVVERSKDPMERKRRIVRRVVPEHLQMVLAVKGRNLVEIQPGLAEKGR